MACLDLEAAIVRPQVHRVGNAGDTPFVHGLCSLGAGYDELLVRISLPVHEEEREFGKKAVVDISERGDGLRAGIAIEATFKSLNCSDEGVPWLVVVGRCDLRSQSAFGHRLEASVSTHHFVVEALELCKLAIVERRQIRSLADLILMRHALGPVHLGLGARSH